ncbi:MAG: hypothetical protein K6T65_16350 [Peptococcaceae bacterium]|nr:hypothetical protein [Peptococcaceae bacterium]
MHHQINPFLQHAVRHGQVLIGESNRAVALSRGIVSACDDIILSINSGNIQGAVNSAQNARNMAGQVAQATWHLNQTINERIEMASYVLNRIQYRVNELSSALQSVKSFSGESLQTEPWRHNLSTPYGQITAPIM